ncbi:MULTISPECIES: hypothetical protein [Dermacoccus]|nr:MULTISPECIES: hypothetical protein [Dermacoccus]MBO1759296.1 hypothetical protein [Dermacoccus sp. NHGro5]MCG7428524.1 hypothetical protein [Dermacoccus nishinomiyaensis]MCT1604590.1 hypothetical protein [Dermacoccus nishinomiyaensis]NHC31673.1 hypothetical protein [Dermacoccus nishinomiyaensis]
MALSDFIEQLKARLSGASDRTGETAQNATDKAGSIDEGDPTRTIVSNDPGTPTDHAV